MDFYWFCSIKHCSVECERGLNLIISELHYNVLLGLIFPIDPMVSIKNNHDYESWISLNE